MKREFLKGLGLEQAVIDSIMSEYGTDVEGLKSQIATLMKEKDTATEALKAYNGVDVEALKNASEALKQEYEGKLKDMRIDGAIEKALSGAKAKHTDLLMDKFDREKIEIDKDGNIKGIEEQLSAFKETYKDLFKVEVSGSNPANPETAGQGFDFGWIPKSE